MYLHYGVPSLQCTFTPVYLHSDLGTQSKQCYLGTNVAIPLSLMVSGVGVEPRGGDLSLKGVANPVVQLVQARRVLGCSVTFLKARVDTGVLPSSAVVFEPSRDWLKRHGLVHGNISPENRS